MSEIDKIAAALVKAQSKFDSITLNKTVKVGAYSYKYADLANIMEAIKPALHENGMAIMQDVSTNDGRIGVSTTLIHTSGQTLKSETLYFPIVKQGAQDLGSLITYGSRYSLKAFLGLVADEDDDAQSITDKQGDKPKSAPPKPKPAPAKQEPEEYDPANLHNLQQGLANLGITTGPDVIAFYREATGNQTIQRGKDMTQAEREKVLAAINKRVDEGVK